MKKYILIFLLGAIAFAGCRKDPWKDIEDTQFRDRMILDIKLAGQVGKSEIETVDSETGTVELKLATFLVEDMSNVKVETIVPSYKAEASVKAGDILDFTAGSPVITITSPSGETREYTVNMTEFSEELLGSYKITTSYIYGGTGVEYGGAAVMEPSTKSWCWNDKGYGPTAEYDDYLEFTFSEVMEDGSTTGKCIHYGGEDSRHWNCIYSGKTATADLHDYYRKIPVGESTWIRNYSDNTLSFIDKDGKKTTGSFIGAGEYQLGVYGSKIYKVTVTDQAFRFDINGPDDWNNIYNDYDKFARKARSYFVLVDRVNDIPEASKTEGSEADTSTEEPEEPEPEEPEIPEDGISGDYIMHEFYVYGGKEPALIKPVDKSWDFNNVKDESDNTLTIKAKDAATGTINYGAGADGKYWDYIFLGKFVKPTAGDDVDCSENYGWLPHGESSYTLSQADDVTTVTVTSGDRTASATVMPAGTTYTYGSKTVTIPADGIGLGYKTKNTGSSVGMYDDYGRFVLCPVEYIMVFKKQQK